MAVVIAATLWILEWLAHLAAFFADILVVAFVAWLLTFLLTPLVDTLEKTRLPRGLGVGLIYAAVLGSLILGSLVVIPPAVDQMARLSQDLPQWVRNLPTATEVQAELGRRGLPMLDLGSIYRPDLLAEPLRSGTTLAAQATLAIASGLVTLGTNLLLVLLLSFYMTLDGRRILTGLITMVPPSWRPEITYVLDQVSRSFGAFLRAQILQAIVVAGATAILMILARLDFVVAASSVVALLMLIPLVGPLLALIPPLLVAGLTAPATFLPLLLALLVIQQLVINILTPRLMSSVLNMPPLVILMALLVGIRIGGFWGALFGIPVAAVLVAVGGSLYRRWLEGQDSKG
jgi:predicted PurR-regulated permease PerM